MHIGSCVTAPASCWASVGLWLPQERVCQLTVVLANGQPASASVLVTQMGKGLLQALAASSGPVQLQACQALSSLACGSVPAALQLASLGAVATATELLGTQAIGQQILAKI